MTVPEMVTGLLDDAEEAAWAPLEEELLLLRQLRGAQPMSQADWALIWADAGKAKSFLLGLFRLKTGYVKKLPWVLAGLAALNEDKAREAGRRALEQWRDAPEESLQHPITWRLFQPGVFLDALEDFVERGRPRQDLPESVRMQIATWRFASPVETKIEQPHAQVSKASKTHFVGPVRVSLSNRLGQLERWLRGGHFSVEELLAEFGRTRRLRDMIDMFGVRAHPAIEKIRSERGRFSVQKLREALVSIIYNVDVDSSFRSMKQAANRHRREKDRIRREELRVGNHGGRRGSTCLLDRVSATNASTIISQTGAFGFA